MLRRALGASSIAVPAAWLFLRPVVLLGDEIVISTSGAGSKWALALDYLGRLSRSEFIVVGVLFGTLTGFAASFTEWALDALRRRVTVSVQFDRYPQVLGLHALATDASCSRDESFRWIIDWLADNEDAKHCGAYVAVADPKAVEPGVVQYSPAPGTYWLSSGSGKWVFVTRRRAGVMGNMHG
jgi:hypothetical protein